MKIIITQSNKVYGPVSDDSTLEGLGYAKEKYYDVFYPDQASLISDKKIKVINPINPEGSIYETILINPWTYWNTDTKLSSIRLQRDYLLSKSDWIVSKYAETLTEVPQNWRDYRQQLRDFPSTVDVNLPIEQIVWPVSP